MSFFILQIGEPTLPKELSRRILKTNSAGLDSYSSDEPRPAKVHSEIGSGAAVYKYHTGNSTEKYACHVWRGPNAFWQIMHKPSTNDRQVKNTPQACHRLLYNFVYTVLTSHEEELWPHPCPSLGRRWNWTLLSYMNIQNGPVVGPTHAAVFAWNPIQVAESVHALRRSCSHPARAAKGSGHLRQSAISRNHQQGSLLYCSVCDLHWTCS